MKIAILSGKGGTGKTMLSVNLSVASHTGIYVDCDVEEPNGHLFFDLLNQKTIPVEVDLPVVINDKCTGCRKCIEFCKFNALAWVGGKVKVFESICHSCGGCSIVCPEMAIVEKKKIIGNILTGEYKDLYVSSGVMNIGEESGVPIIKALLKNVDEENKSLLRDNIIIDCPPGSSCLVSESIKDADYVILVAEPTIFGTQNLEMVHELVKMSDKPYGCVLNKCEDYENPSEIYCQENGIKILGKIDNDLELARLISSGRILVNEDSKYSELFRSILNRVTLEVNKQ